MSRFSLSLIEKHFIEFLIINIFWIYSGRHKRKFCLKFIKLKWLLTVTLPLKPQESLTNLENNYRDLRRCMWSFNSLEWMLWFFDNIFTSFVCLQINIYLTTWHPPPPPITAFIFFKNIFRLIFFSMLTLHYEWKLKSIKYLKQCATLYNFFMVIMVW